MNLFGTLPSNTSRPSWKKQSTFKGHIELDQRGRQREGALENARMDDVAVVICIYLDTRGYRSPTGNKAAMTSERKRCIVEFFAESK